MRTCNCGNIIPLRIKIEGDWKNLQNRKSCLDCLPFGASKYRKKSKEEKRSKGAAKSKRYYHNYKKKHGIDPVSKLRNNKKQKIVDLVGGCQLCGYNKCLRNLSFHHLRDKKFKLSTREFQYSMDKIIKEVMKCVLVCHNCHGEIHEGLVNEKFVEKQNAILASKLETIKQ